MTIKPLHRIMFLGAWMGGLALAWALSVQVACGPRRTAPCDTARREQGFPDDSDPAQYADAVEAVGNGSVLDDRQDDGVNPPPAPWNRRRSTGTLTGTMFGVRLTRAGKYAVYTRSETNGLKIYLEHPDFGNLWVQVVKRPASQSPPRDRNASYNMFGQNRLDFSMGNTWRHARLDADRNNLRMELSNIETNFGTETWKFSNVNETTTRMERIIILSDGGLAMANREGWPTEDAGADAPGRRRIRDEVTLTRTHR